MPVHQQQRSLRKPPSERPRLRPNLETRERTDPQAMPKQSSGPLLTLSPVLITESADEFSGLRDALKDQFKPQGAFEHFRVDEIAALMWEIRRYRRAKTILINSAYREALENLLKRVCREPGESFSGIQEYTDDLAHKWFGNDESAKQEVLEKLASFKLDENAIEAEAMSIMAADLETFDRSLASQEWCLNKALRSLAEFRGGLGRHLHATVERMIDGEVLSLGNASKKPPPAAA